MLSPPRTRPLRWVLIVPFLLQLGLAVGLTLWLSLRNGQRAVDEVASELRSELSLHILEYLDRYLEVPQRINQLNVDAFTLGQLDPMDAVGMGQHFWHQLQRFETVSFIFFGSAAGGAAGAGRIRDGTSVVDSTPVDLRAGLVAGPRFEFEALEAGRRGPQLKSTPGFDARQRPWFEAALEEGGPVWSDVYPFFAEESLAVAASQPSLGSDGDLVGVVGAEFTLARIGDFLRRLEVGKTGLTFVVERNGRMIASSTGDPLFDPSGTQARLRALDSSEPLTQATARFLAQRPGGLGSITHAEQLAFDLAGERQFVHVAPLLAPRGLDWRVVVVLPEADFMEHIRTSTRSTLWLSLGALLLAIGLGVLTARRINRPVAELRLAARQISGGRLDHEVPASTIDELGDLARAFNRMAEQLRESFDALETRVEERTAELQEASAQADAANRAKSRFLANISHEIRSPLSAILGYAELLEGTVENDEKRRHYLTTIRRSGSHLSRLLSDLLDISRIEAGRLELNVRTCELVPLIADLASEVEPQATEKSLTLQVDTTAWLPGRCATDPTRLRQVLSNLLSNAVRYTETGRVELSLRAVEVREGHTPTRANLIFVVKDTGVGIRREDQERLFQRFVQLEPSRQSGAGFGLGLAVTRQLVELMGGEIAVDSEPDRGSCFTLRLPFEECEQWASRRSIHASRDGTAATSGLALLDGKVLIADDSPELLELCSSMLKRWGLECATAADGSEAVVRARGESFDLVLMDWQMPRMDGLEATRALRARGVDIPIIALTAAAQHGDREKCLTAGCTGYLVKPIDFKELHRLLSRVLGDEAPGGFVDRDTGLAELTHSYLEGLPAKIDRLGAELARGDWPAFDAALHQLAGTAGSFGFDGVFAAAEVLEKHAAERGVEELQPLLARLRSAVDKARRSEHA